ncbi:tripartite tricarboxylate transporter TctB family protein [Massilia niastensis]|uniref:tripartite tricarboxylate transporter TctB family protein n=1 Tax=Massilia niastensis TaxID=544911 RepID=UPI000380810C|nr:tripartite tricarboxylate transporter TctB family protein [Massilia niastensis]
MQIKNQQDFWAGLLFTAFGLLFAGFGTRYAFGSAADMGAGYFPTLLGVLMTLIGLFVAAGALSPKAEEQKVNRFAWTTLLLVLGSVVLFGLLLEALGLVLCILMVVGVSSYASHEFSWKAAIANAAFLIALSLFVFIYALKLQFPIWPAVFSA